MEKWITPEVVIEEFASNQYVAACTVDVRSVNSNYIDLAYGVPTTGIIFSWGTGDGYEEDQETVQSKQGYTLHFDGPTLVWNLPEDWYTNIMLYGGHVLGVYIDESGPYDIYVHRDGRTFYADIYTTGAADAAASGKSPSNHS